MSLTLKRSKSAILCDPQNFDLDFLDNGSGERKCQMKLDRKSCMDFQMVQIILASGDL